MVAPELLLPALVVVLSPLLIAAVLLALLVLAEQKLLELALVQLGELEKFSILLPKKTDLLPQALLTLLLALLQELLSRSDEVLEDLVNELISRLLAQIEQDDGDNNRDVGSERVDGVCLEPPRTLKRIETGLLVGDHHSGKSGATANPEAD